MDASSGHRCYRCDSERTISGSTNHRKYFRPSGLKFFSLSFRIPEVPFGPQATACVDCGLIWLELSPDVLRKKKLEALGDEDLKTRLKLDGR